MGTTMEPIVEFIEEEEEFEVDLLAKTAKKKKSPKKKSPKKKKAKKAKKKSGKKKKKAKKAKKPKKKKSSGKNASKHARKSKLKKAQGKKFAARMKAKGKGIFAAKSLSPALAGIVGKKSASRVDVTKAVWKYIKSKKLNKGRKITADAKLAAATKAGSFDMLKLPGLLSKHIK